MRLLTGTLNEMTKKIKIKEKTVKMKTIT